MNIPTPTNTPESATESPVAVILESHASTAIPSEDVEYPGFGQLLAPSMDSFVAGNANPPDLDWLEKLQAFLLLPGLYMDIVWEKVASFFGTRRDDKIAEQKHKEFVRAQLKGYRNGFRMFNHSIQGDDKFSDCALITCFDRGDYKTDCQ